MHSFKLKKNLISQYFLQIDYLLDGSHNLIPISEIIDKYNIGADSGTMREITSNITHCGTTDSLHTMRSDKETWEICY